MADGCLAWKTAAHGLGGRERKGHSRLSGPSPLNDPPATRRNVFSRTFGDLVSGLEGLCYGSAPKISVRRAQRMTGATSSLHSVLSARGTSVGDTGTLLHLLRRMEQKLPARGGLCNRPPAPPPSPQPGPPAAPAAALSKLEVGIPSPEWPQPERMTRCRTAAPTRPQAPPARPDAGKVRARGEGEHT